LKFRGLTDLVLLHPPSVYDFREMLIIPSPIADLVPSGTFFEMYPVGFSFLGEYLERYGFKVRVVNLAARMLAEPRFDVERYISRLDPLAFGIGFHWLPHAHGAVEIARICKRAHPDTPVIMGGYSASFFDRELMEYPEIDYVIRGDSGEEPLRRLMMAIRDDRDPSAIPNLTSRGNSPSEVFTSPLDFVPPDLSHLGSNYDFMIRSAVRNLDPRGIKAFKGWWSYPVAALLTVKGCLNDCSFCGGSAFAMDRCFNRRGIALRSPADVAADLESIARFTGAPVFVIGDLRQGGEAYASEVLERIGRLSVRNQVVLELFGPAPRAFFDEVARALPHFNIELSPETHDDEIRRSSGKLYSADSVAASIGAALDAGCGRFDLFFIIGLQGQTPASVTETVEWCDALLGEFGTRLNPLIGPLAPFLDPGSIAREKASSRGYRVRYRTLEEHRQALLEPHWRDLLGYETDCMSRQEIVDATYAALLELNRVKEKHRQISREYADAMDRLLRENIALLRRLDVIREMPEEPPRERELASLKRDAERLRATSDLVKDELAWPVQGRRFHIAAIAGVLIKGKNKW
jgi:B12-binding domain/radical SAM domain protein